MPKLLTADPAARRQAVLLVILGAIAAALLILGFERYQTPLRDWLLSGPGEPAHRAKVVFLSLAAVLCAPMVMFAIYLWSLGGRVLRARQFPPPGYRVVHDTPVIEEQAAVSRGRGLKLLALCLGAGSVLLLLSFWRLAWSLTERLS